MICRVAKILPQFISCDTDGVWLETHHIHIRFMAWVLSTLIISVMAARLAKKKVAKRHVNHLIRLRAPTTNVKAQMDRWIGWLPHCVFCIIICSAQWRGWELEGDNGGGEGYLTWISISNLMCGICQSTKKGNYLILIHLPPLFPPCRWGLQSVSSQRQRS